MPMTEPQPPSPDRLPPPLVVAITARALFHMEDSHALFEREGIQAFAEFQRQREDDVLPPGIAFPLVRKLLALNAGAPADAPRVEVILLSRNSSDTGLRVFNSIQHHGLDIRRATFTAGARSGPTSSRSARSCSCRPTPNRCVRRWKRAWPPPPSCRRRQVNRASASCASPSMAMR